jgi:hypothetical protein
MARITRFLLDILHIRPKRTQHLHPRISQPISHPIRREPTPDMPFPHAKDPHTHHQRLTPQTPTFASPAPSPALESPYSPYYHNNISETALLPTPNTHAHASRTPSTAPPTPAPRRRASARYSPVSRTRSQRRQTSYFSSAPSDIPGLPGSGKLSPSERFSRSYVVVRGDEAELAEQRKNRLSRRVSVGLQAYGTHGRIYAP